MINVTVCLQLSILIRKPQIFFFLISLKGQSLLTWPIIHFVQAPRCCAKKGGMFYSSHKSTRWHVFMLNLRHLIGFLNIIGTWCWNTLKQISMNQHKHIGNFQKDIAYMFILRNGTRRKIQNFYFIIKNRNLREYP